MESAPSFLRKLPPSLLIALGIALGFIASPTSQSRTAEDRLAALEKKVASLEYKTQDMIRIVSDDGRVPGIQFNSRVSFGGTNYFLRQPINKGATVSITNGGVDPVGMWVELENGRDGFSPLFERPSTGIFVASIAHHRPEDKQPSIAIEAHAYNNPVGNLPYYGDYGVGTNAPMPQEGMRLIEVNDTNGNDRIELNKGISLFADGIQLHDGKKQVNKWFLRKVGSVERIIWP